MKILVYGLNYSPELAGIGKYTSEMVTWLAERGHVCHIITTPPYYPAWKVSAEYSSWKFKKEQSGNVTVYRCPLWVPSRPQTISRVLHLLSFNISSFPLLCGQIFWRADVVICIAPSFLATPQGLLFSKLSGAKSWLHFQDFEICAMFGFGVASSWSGISKIAHTSQAFITRYFDVISTISHAMCKRAETKNVSKDGIVLFPNWVDVDFITPDADRSYFRRKWRIDDNTKVVLYSGNLGKKQAFGSLVAAASALQNRVDILFIIVGDGAHKTVIQKMVEELELTNVRFYPLQPYEHLPALLRMADVHLVLQKRGAADAVLPSKLTSIFSVGGHAIITAEPNTELGHIVTQNPGIATLIEPGNKQALTSAIIGCCNNPANMYGQINKQARNYAVKQLGKEPVLSQFEKALTILVNCKCATRIRTKS